jgi:non-specific serine/threonine protein kinase
LLQGNVDKSVAELEACLEVFRDVGDDEQTAVCLVRLSRAARLQGELVTAAAHVSESGVVALRCGNIRIGWELLSEAASLAAVWSEADQDNATGDLVYIAQEEMRRATQLFAAADKLAGDRGLRGPPYAARQFDHDKSQLRTGLGEDAYGEAAAEGGDLTLDQAFRLAASAAGAAHLTRLEEHLAAARRTPLQAQKAAFGGLTAREREVAALLVRGLTNPQIAEELTVSPKTVEHHVGNILSKLGFENRAEVAAWAVKKGLAEAPEDLDSRIEKGR